MSERTPKPTWSAPALTPDDPRAAAACCLEALSPALARDWSVPAGDLEWTCHHTLDHISDALSFYATNLATRSTTRRSSVRDGAPNRPPDVLLEMVESSAAILAAVVRAAPPDARGFHPAGMADATGFLAMGCTEILIHTADIAQGFRLPVRAPDELAAKVIARIFPWAPVGFPAWETLRWCAGRGPLPDRPRQDEFWFWHCAPLAEWDGAVRRRARPPAGTR